jgi:outer membrane protein assembly factor BamB
MKRRRNWVRGLVLGVGLVLIGSRAGAVITVLTPLRDALARNQFICVAKIEKFLPEKPAAVLVVTDDLKGKLPYRRLPVTLTGDAASQKSGQTTQLLKRLAIDLPLVLFANESEGRLEVFAYTNGTWFMLRGQRGDSPEKAVLAFKHLEPWLRRTFKGTTAELRQVIVDALSSKKQPPDANPSEPPGLGPEIDAAKKSAFHAIAEPPAAMPPLFAVIPTLGLGGPLALLALLFPTLFGGVLLLFRRWLVFFTVISLVSTLYLLHWWFAEEMLSSWWGTETALWACMTLITLGGVLWAWRRHARVAVGELVMPEAPPRTELLVLGVLGLTCLGMLIFYAVSAPATVDTTQNLLRVFAFSIWAGMLYRLGIMLRGGKSVLPTEGVMLWAAGLGFTAIALLRPGSTMTPAQADVAGDDRPIASLDTEKTWSVVFRTKGDGLIVSSPRLVGDRLYVAAAHRRGFGNFGVVYGLDPLSQKVLWSFDDDGDMKQVFSSPCVADGRLFIGEGFHDDQNCKIYCLDAATGAKRWEFLTSGQTESSPCVADGKVFFGAGNDGVYALDAATGKEIWHFQGKAPGSLRIGAGPAVQGKRLYVGSGVDRNRPDNPGETALLCLDTDTGKVVWRIPTNLPCWGTPAVAENEVFFGLGNGDVFQDASQPAGAMLCVSADSGQQRWRFDVPNGVLNRPALDRFRVYFGCRDGSCYCLKRRDGQLRWKQGIGSSIVASPVTDDASEHGRALTVFAIGTTGQVCCLDAHTGKVHWSYAELQGRAAHLSSSPALAVRPTVSGDRRCLYFGAALNGLKIPAVYCLIDLLPEG